MAAGEAGSRTTTQGVRRTDAKPGAYCTTHPDFSTDRTCSSIGLRV